MNSLRNKFDWFNPSGAPIRRAYYVAAGVSLMLLKYLVELATIKQTTGLAYSPLDFASPSLLRRNVFLEAGPEWLGVAWLLWTLPFIWIALALTIRRFVDAGWSPWLSLLVLVPVLNFLVMGLGALLPHSRKYESFDGLKENDLLVLVDDQNRNFSNDDSKALASFLNATLVGVVYASLLIFSGVYLIRDYGVMVFFGTPLVAGAASGYLLNRDHPSTVRYSFLHATGVVITVFSFQLLLAFEGLICLVMAAPIFLPIALIGALVGRAIAIEQHSSPSQKEKGMLGALVLLPVLGFAESQLPKPPVKMVETSIVINASQQAVWNTVIAFPPITSEAPWYFHAGIASPKSAYIKGEGVGAVRHCQFTTGDFVEPITVWDEPNRLSFDVSDQPEPMFELTPYREIHPPHLEGTLQSKRGEFLLEPLAEGKTRLVGRTWYQLDMAPRSYWTIWTDWILHRVHYRVLDHIRQVSE